MRCLVTVLACLCLAVPPHAAPAQETGTQPLEIGPSGRAYLDSLRYRRIQTDVGYYDPTGALPPLETRQKPAAVPEPGDGVPVAAPSAMRTLIGLLAVAALLAVALLVVRNAGGFALSLQTEAQNPARTARQRGPRANPGDAPPAALGTILATSDRRRALVLLAQAALARAVAAQGVLLQPSWTLRETLAHVPGGQPQARALRDLVLAGERVLFGNRDVTEAEFQAHLAAIRPIVESPA